MATPSLAEQVMRNCLDIQACLELLQVNQDRTNRSLYNAIVGATKAMLTMAERRIEASDLEALRRERASVFMDLSASFPKPRG